MPLTPRERVLTTLNHEQPDRVPIVLGVSNATGIKMKPYQGIKKTIGVDASDEYIYDWPELGTAHIDEDTMHRLHSDVRGVLDLEPETTRTRNRERDPHSDCIDSWGSGQTEIVPGDWFPSIHPLPEAETVEELDKLGYKDGLSMIVYRNLEDLCEKIEYFSQNPEELVSLQNGAREAASQ